MTVERNVYFAASALSEGEDTYLPTLQGKQPNTSTTPTTSLSPVPLPSPPAQVPHVPDHAPVEAPPSQPPPLCRSTCTKKPSHRVCDLQSGEGVGLQLPGAFAKDSEEAGGAWSVKDGTPVLLEDFDGLECALAAETADAEALEPRTLAKAKHRPDWP